MGANKFYKHNLTVTSRLLGYHPLIIILRFIVVSFIAVSILYIIAYTVGPHENWSIKIPLNFFVIMIAAFYVAAEVQIGLDLIMEKILPIPNKIRLRLAIQFLSGIIVLLISVRVVLGYIEPELYPEHSRAGITMGLVFGFLFMFVLSNALILTRFTEKWSRSQKQISEMKREKLRMDYNSLQDQLNPHFLFNNLSILKSLIIYDSDSAVKFTENFTDVYRYVLRSREKQLVKLSEELEFINSYIDLHKERLGDGLSVSYSIDKESLDKKIAPITLQLLIENAIKHNSVEAESPLKITITSGNGYIQIRNNVQLKESYYSTKTGLGNLLKRYELLTEMKIKITSDTDYFSVSIPLL